MRGADAFELAGVDYLVVSPQVLASLGASATTEGYNDGLTAAADDFDSAIKRQLSTESAAIAEFTQDELADVSEASFKGG